MLHERVLSDADVLGLVDVAVDFFEDLSTGVCTGAFDHTTRCTNQTLGDGYCTCLADAANLCAKAHDANWWAFTACMFANNGSPDAAPGLESDETFERTVKACTAAHLSYDFNDLKACYTGVQGSQLAFVSAHRTEASGQPHPMWLFVDGESVQVSGLPPHSNEELVEWADKVKARIMAAVAVSV